MTREEQQTTEEVQEFLHGFAKSYDSNDRRFFDNFSEEATFFSLSVPTRVEGLESYRKGFEQNYLGGEDRRTQILSPDVQPLGANAALITFHNRIQVKDATSNNRVTMAVVKENGNWKVVHLHASPVGAPEITVSPGSVENIRILEERVATAVATFGAPK